MTEKEFVDGLISSNENLFELFVNKYQESVIKTCYAFLHNMDDAHDVAQEVFIKSFKSIRDFKGKSALSTWLYRIAVNKSLNFIRDNKKEKLFVHIDHISEKSKNNAAEFIEKDNNPIFKKEEKEHKKKVIFKAIDRLPENQRTAFLLNKYHDFSYKEISEIMGISISSVESILHRAKFKLQKELVRLNKNL